MPYIKPSYRKELDATIDALAEKLRAAGRQEPADLCGNINYSVSRLLYKVYGANPRYSQHNEIMGVLECIKQEWYRRMASPYEEVKIKENGDVFKE